MRMDKLTTKLQQALQDAINLAQENQHQQVEPEHLIYALLKQEDSILFPVLDKIGTPSFSIVKELEKEPMRQSDLSEKTNIKGGNFKHHMSILKEKGLVHQEGVRERYMLAFAGREALKLAEFLYHRAKKPKSVPIVIDEEETTLDDTEEE